MGCQQCVGFRGHSSLDAASDAYAGPPLGAEHNPGEDTFEDVSMLGTKFVIPDDQEDGKYIGKGEGEVAETTIKDEKSETSTTPAGRWIQYVILS
eukprot:1337228-Amorphochlora_amoeboformis.AAC.2